MNNKGTKETKRGEFTTKYTKDTKRGARESAETRIARIDANSLLSGVVIYLMVVGRVAPRAPSW